MKHLIIYESGKQAVVENCVIESNGAVVEEIRLDHLSKDEQKTIIDNRRDLALERDSKGKLEAVRIGKKRVAIPRNG